MTDLQGVRVVAIGLVGLMTLGTAAGGTVAARAAGATAQPSASQTDIQTLQEELESLRSEVAQLPDAAARLEELTSAIDTLDDEIAYLRVKLRRNDPVSQGEVDELRRRIGRLQNQLSDSPSRFQQDVTIPVGTEMDVRLQSSLNSDTSQVEDRFYATVVNDLVLADRRAVPAGAEARGLVSAVDRSSRTDRSASLTLAFDQITVEGRTYPARLTLTEAQDSGIRDEIDRIGIGAAVGGVIGGLIGGGRGTVTGILIGAGGTVAATEGEDVELSAGTVLRVRFDSTVTILGDGR